MRNWFAALLAGALFGAVGIGGQPDDLKYAINGATPEAWVVWGATWSLRNDNAVGKVMRLSVDRKVDFAWQAAAINSIVKPVAKGDVIQVSYWARSEVPPAGSENGNLAAVNVGILRPPYSNVVHDSVSIGRAWHHYVAAGIADADYQTGQLQFSVQLGPDKQVIELGSVAVLDYGPDPSKLHSGTKLQAIVSPNTFADELARLTAKLPAKGKLISDPGAQIWRYGKDQVTKILDVNDVPGGKALRSIMTKPAEHAWDDGVSMPLTGDIKTGDVLLVAVWLRASDLAKDGSAGQIMDMGLHMGRAPWTAVATASLILPKNEWKVVYASGVATADYPVGTVNFGLQTGCCQQTIDIGPVFVLNLGPGIEPFALPLNR